jgi:hypothetical protein
MNWEDVEGCGRALIYGAITAFVWRLRKRTKNSPENSNAPGRDMNLGHP